MSRRRSLLVLLATMVAAAVVTRAAFRAEPGSGRQTLLTYVLVAVLLAGTYVSGGWPPAHRRRGRRPVVGPALTALLLFCLFAVGGWVASWIGPFDRAVDVVVERGRAGPAWEVALGAVAAGAAEEAFFRGALWERVRLPLLTTAFAHMATTLLAANVALTLAAGVLGVTVGLSRRASGGWWAPAVTHVVWTLLVVAWLPT